MAIRRLALASLLVLGGCPADYFGPAFWVDNQTDQPVYVSTSSIGFLPWTVQPETFAQGDFVVEGTELYVLDQNCAILGSVTVDLDVTIVVAVGGLISTSPPPQDEKAALPNGDAEWPPGCAPNVPASS